MVNQYSQDFSKSTDSFKSRRGGAEWWSGECPISKKGYFTQGRQMSSVTQGVFYCDSSPNFYPDGDCDFPQVDDWWQSKY